MVRDLTGEQMSEHRFARSVALGLAIGALAAPGAAAHHQDPGTPDSRASLQAHPSGGIDGRVAAIGTVGLLGLGVGAAVALGRRKQASGGPGASVATDQPKGAAP
jgi:hypothetical protein